MNETRSNRRLKSSGRFEVSVLFTGVLRNISYDQSVNKQIKKDLLQLGSRVLYLNPCFISVGMPDDLLLLPKLDNYSVFEHDFESLWLWGSIIFTSETMKRRTCWCTKAILWQLNSVNTFVGFMLYNFRTEI